VDDPAATDVDTVMRVSEPGRHDVCRKRRDFTLSQSPFAIVEGGLDAGARGDVALHSHERLNTSVDLMPTLDASRIALMSARLRIVAGVYASAA